MVKILRQNPSNGHTQPKSSLLTKSLTPGVSGFWKILIVDDEPTVHQLTALNLTEFTYEGHKLKFYNAFSAQEGKQVLQDHADFALALIDVVMESDMAGLDLVNYIRNDLHNHSIRLIIRTGQPGLAPEQSVIDRYDIDDYKEKTELTAQKLYTTVRCALKSYNDIQRIESTKKGLAHILSSSPSLFKLRQMDTFFEGILTQTLSLYNIASLGHHALSAGTPALALIASKDSPDALEINYRCGTGRFSKPSEECTQIIQRFGENDGNRPESGRLYLPMVVGFQTVGFIYLENVHKLTHDQWQILFIFANQCATGIENLWLNNEVKAAYREIHYRLAVASEYKDWDTGSHINRIVYFTRLLALQLNFSKESAEELALASMLHDLGKMGVSETILQKTSRLNHDEFEIIKRHPEIGLKIIGDSPHFELIRQITLGHHERWDGTGYPQGLMGEEIPLAARIVGVADVFDALISPRPYKPAWNLTDTLAEIQAKKGQHFDPKVVDALLELHQCGELETILNLFPGK
ncbi:MAG: DUF3369 domain-containing protein [Magnetococcus sp. DMHC-6]